MIPVYLSFEAFGPYLKKQEIDFQKLREAGLFLISGQTGAGKTAILDAMTYALFGKSSGNERGELSAMRSDFAGEDVPTAVEFVFAVGQREYKFTRGVYVHKKRSGEKELRAEQNVFFRDEEGRFSPYFENPKISSVYQKAEELLGLTYDQFRKVILLPQGQFEKLLTSDSAEKEKILTTLFHAQRWDKITSWLCDKANEMKRQNEEQEVGMRSLLAQFDCETAEALQQQLEEIQPVLADLGKKRDRFAATEKKTQQELADIEALVKLFDQKATVQGELQTLDAQKEQYELMKQAVLRAADAQKLQPFRQNAAQRMQESEHRKQQLDMAKAKKESAVQALKQSVERLGGLVSYLKEGQIKLRAQSEERGAELARAEKEQAALFDAYLKNAAWVLAENLEEGQPCPVCGSTTHSARPHKAEEVSAGQVRQAEENVKLLRKELDKIASDQKDIARDIAECEGELEKFPAGQWKDAKLRKGSKADCLDEVRSAAQQVQTAEVQWQTAENELQTAEKVYCQALDEYKQECARLGFETDSQVKQSIMSEQQISDYNKDVEEYRLKRKSAQQALKELEQKLDGALQPDTAPVKEKLRQAQQEKQQAEQEHARQKAQADLMEQTLQKVQKLNASLQESREEAAELDTYAKLLRGDLGVGLKRYVLGVMLSMIAQQANLLLKKVHGGRYELFRTSEGTGRARKVGLDLEVFDRNTGERRHVNGLSGGEKFLVSLALSLGLSAVVQAQSGGIRMDALFIDEGFGSLDPDSIDDALAVLSGIRGGTRMVGIISHVQMLKESIETRIEVQKTRWGSELEIKA